MDDGNEPGGVRGGGQDWRSDKPKRKGIYLREYVREDGSREYFYSRFDGWFWFCGHPTKYRALSEMDYGTPQNLRWREEKDAVKEI